MKEMNKTKHSILASKKSKQNILLQLNVVMNLKNHKDRDIIKSLLEDYKNEERANYFHTQSNISLGKIITNNNRKVLIDKNNKISPYSYSGFNTINNTRKQTLRQSKIKSSNSLTTSRIEKQKLSNKELLNTNNHHSIDNKSLKNYYNEIRQRISQEKNYKKDKYKLLTEVPFPIRKSLIDQENIFRKIIKEKKIENSIQEKLVKKSNKENNRDLLINKNENFDKKNQELSIIDKNLTIDNKYRDNLWNITLRNLPIKGKYEKVGYMNVGNNYEPRYTFFNINKTNEYFNNPRYDRNKSQDYNKYKNKNDFYSTLNEDNYNLKTRQKLNILEKIKDLEINGKNLLDVEDKRETEIRGKKIIYKKEDLDYLLFKKKEKSKNNIDKEKEMKLILDNIYEEKTFYRNYKINDFFKNTNLTSKYSHNLDI